MKVKIDGWDIVHSREPSKLNRNALEHTSGCLSRIQRTIGGPVYVKLKCSIQTKTVCIPHVKQEMMYKLGVHRLRSTSIGNLCQQQTASIGNLCQQQTAIKLLTRKTCVW